MALPSPQPDHQAGNDEKGENKIHDWNETVPHRQPREGFGDLDGDPAKAPEQGTRCGPLTAGDRARLYERRSALTAHFGRARSAALGGLRLYLLFSRHCQINWA